ncbi:transmembrane protein [Anaeramoeba flamelloides]|uniref:Transmembrane protein n=1 Tax=Anaeramoeba flamelloides TaxID=1746091 RepID=A0ABQ8YH44_9EUKA|nr:transmembrane protein [Anaeramoeba flamelloides]
MLHGFSTMEMKYERWSIKKLIAFFFTFLCLTLIFTIITYNGPEVWSEETQSFEVKDTFAKKEMDITIENLEPINRPLVLSVRMNNKEDMTIRAPVKFNIQVYGLQPKKNEKIDENSDDNEEEEGVLLSSSERKRIIGCQAKKVCGDTRLIREPNIRYTRYRIKIVMMRAFERAFFTDYELVFKYKRKELATFELYFRYAFLLTSCALVIYITWKTQGIPFKAYSTGQKWTAYLLPILILFNNPFSPFVIFPTTITPDIFDALFSTFFISVLLLFILCMIDNIRAPIESRSFRKFYLPKIVLVGIGFFIVNIVYIYDRITLPDDLQFRSIYDWAAIKAIAILLTVLFVVYIIWMILAIMITWYKVKDNKKVAFKFKFFIILTSLVLIFFILLFFVRISAKTQNTTVSHLSSYILFNFYVYFLTYAYLPSNAYLKKSEKLLKSSTHFDDDYDDELELQMNSNNNNVNKNKTNDHFLLRNKRKTNNQDSENYDDEITLEVNENSLDQSEDISNVHSKND